MEKTYKEKLLEIFKDKRHELMNAEANDYNTGAFDMLEAVIKVVEKTRD